MKRTTFSIRKNALNLTYSSFLCFLFFATNPLSAQVGINNTNPKASLDITAADPADPQNTEGLLVPRVSVFPTSDPGADQDGMLMYLTTTVGLNTPGFYYWNQTTWLKVSNSNEVSSDADFFEEGTTTAPDDITDDIFHLGNMAIGKNTADYTLDIESNGTRGINTLINGSGSSDKYGLYIQNTSTGNGVNFGTYTSLSGNGHSIQYGNLTLITNSGPSNHFGFGASLSGSGSGYKYGFYSYMNASAGGTHYGVHSTALKSGSFAGYFLGKVSIGTTTINNYSLPDSRGTANQVMQTDGSGNVSWVNSNTLLSASNGLSISGGDVILGGTLTQATTITQGTHSYYHNLNSSGDFFVQDAGVNVFEVSSNGNSYFGSDTYWKDVNTAGVTLAALIDDGDDGRFILYENGMASVDLDANSSFTFNEQGLDRDFRIEGDNNANLFYVDAGNDVVSFGRNNPTLTNNGATVNGVTLDYVADFELASGGTTVGLGSLEYVADVGSNLLAFSASLLPSANDTRDLGSAALRWDDVYATNGTIQTSDIRDKKNITEISYGLNELLALNPIRFQWKNSHDPKAKLGFSAQQIQKIIPEVVKEYDYVFPENGAAPIKKQNERLGVYYSDLIPVTVKAIQEQQEIIDSQQKTIQKLEKKQDETNALLKLLQQRIERLEGKN